MTDNVIEKLVIYHADCDDGTASAAVANYVLRGNVDFKAANYGDPPPDVANKLVYILDFCYKPDVLKEIADKAAAVMVLDHHISAMKACKEAFDMKTLTFNGKPHREDRTCFLVEKNLHIIFDMDRSGVGLAWDHFMQNRPKPAFVEYIQANDLWKHDSMVKTREVVRWIRSHDHTVVSYEDLLHRMMNPDVLRQAIVEGEAIERYFQQTVKNHINWSDVRVIKLKDTQGLCVNAPRTMISEVGHFLAESCNGFGCVWYPRDGRAYVSLRSLEGGPDVSEIAKHYGGGGHRNAAGFEMDLFGFVMGVYTSEKV